MKRIDLLGPLGLAVIVGAEAWARSGRSLPGQPAWYVYAGVALIVLHLVLRFEDMVRGIGRRQMRYGANAVAVIAIVSAILAGVNWVVARHPKRWDLTKNQRYSLSEETKKLLAGLKDDVRILYFQRATGDAGEARLKELQAASPRIKTEFIDPIAKPALAREFEITSVPTLVVERGGRREKIQNDSEQDIANALIKVTRDVKKTVCFAEGEGEANIDEFGDRGYSGAKTALTKSQYETQKVVLLREPKVPESCTVLVVAGPQKDLLAPAIDAIRNFVRGGGKALILIEPELQGSAFPNLSALLKEWNLETGKDVVVDISLQNQLSGTGPLSPVAKSFPYHEITKDFRFATVFHTARSVKAGTANVPGLRTQGLVDTEPQSWAETDLALKEPVELNPGKDQQGPISLGAVATLDLDAPAASPSPTPGPPPAETKPKREARIVAMGDADFASNGFLAFPGNQDLFVNTVAWLAEDADLISIRPKDADDQRLFLTREQLQLTFLFSLVFLPGLFVVLGVVAWWKRR